MNAGYLRVAYMYSAIGFLPRGWPTQWLKSKQLARLQIYQLVGSFVSRPDWRHLGLNGPYDTSGYYPPGSGLLNVFSELGMTCPPPPPPERLLHQLQLLAVMDGLSDTELSTWWTEAELIRELAQTLDRFRVPDGIYRTDGGEWIAIEIWSRSETDPILQAKLHDLWRYTHADRIRIVGLNGITSEHVRAEVAMDA